MAKLKPLSRLVEDVRENDLVQFYRTENGEKEKLNEPKKSYVGYYRGLYVSGHFRGSLEECSLMIKEQSLPAFSNKQNGSYTFNNPAAFFISLSPIGFGSIHSEDDIEEILGDFEKVSHYKILQRAEQGEK